MKVSVEQKYLLIFVLTFISILGLFGASIFNTDPGIFKSVITSCTTVYSAISSVPDFSNGFFIIGLLSVLGIFFGKLLLSIIKTRNHSKMVSQLSTPHYSKKIIAALKATHISSSHLVILKNSAPMAYTAGVLFPKIILSTGMVWMLSQRELEAVLLHEYYHLRHRHGFLYILAEAMSSSVMLLVPVLKDIVLLMKEELELVSDRFASQQQGSDAYISASLNKVGALLQTDGVYPGFSSLLRERLRVTSKKPRLSVQRLLLSFCSVTVLLVLVFIPANNQRLVAQAIESEACMENSACSELCINEYQIGMSKNRIYSSNLPTSMF